MPLTNTLSLLRSAISDPIDEPISADTFIRACQFLGWNRRLAAKSLDVKLRSIYVYNSGQQRVPAHVQRLLLCHCIFAGLSSFDELPQRDAPVPKSKNVGRPKKRTTVLMKPKNPPKENFSIPVAQVTDFSFI